MQPISEPFPENVLECRDMALLERARSRLPLSPKYAFFMLLVWTTMVTSGAFVRLAAREVISAADDSTQRSTAPDPLSDADGQEGDHADTTTVIIQGRVVLPDGSPAVGATVRAAAPMFAMLEPILGKDFEAPVSQVIVDALGRFELCFPSQPYGDLRRLDKRWQDSWKRTTVAASLPGYGPQWVAYDKMEDPRKLITLKLVEDLPIQGRVIDLEGNPVTGLAVQIGGLRASVNEDLSGWIEAANNGETPWTIYHRTPRNVELKLIGFPESVTTNEQGRFTICGVGRERHLSLLFESEAVAHQQVTVATRPMESIQRVISEPPHAGFETVYGVEFTHTAAPARLVVGTVRVADTGEPMPGVAVESYKLTDYPYFNHRVLKTITDQRGRYRVTGMPKGDGNHLLVLPNDDQPYLMRQVEVPNPTGLEPVELDINIHRGLWITGRITDKMTGEPVLGARIHYLPYCV